jgi:glycosyltransferase XagB
MKPESRSTGSGRSGSRARPSVPPRLSGTRVRELERGASQAVEPAAAEAATSAAEAEAAEARGQPAPAAEALPLPAPEPTHGSGPVGLRSEYVPLKAHLRADSVLSTWQRRWLMLAVASLGGLTVLRLETGLGPPLSIYAQGFLCALTIVNFAIIVYKARLMAKAFGYKPASPDDSELRQPPRGGWPSINVIVPMFHEGELVLQLVQHLCAIDYPRDRMFVRLAIEESDTGLGSTLSAIERGGWGINDQMQLVSMPFTGDGTIGARVTSQDGTDRWAESGIILKLPDNFRVVVCPPREPMGKPGACNYVLRTDAPGELTVVFDVEDIPDPLQLKKAAHAFATGRPRDVCYQAELQYHNVNTNRLTRLFSSEYAMHFGLMLKGLVRTGAPVPLGGTSNYLRTDALLALGGWDEFNVTEDATLGYTIARRGWRVRVLESVTLEEANSEGRNWIRQRSRWIKGYTQTWLVHMRNPWKLWRDLGTRGFCSFQLTVGFATITTLLNPVLWGLTAFYFGARIADLHRGTEWVQSLFPAPVFYAGLSSMVIGNLLVVYFHLAGCMLRRLDRALLTVVLLPLYWWMMFWAACRAFVELVHERKRFEWAHTIHGLDEAPEHYYAARETTARRQRAPGQHAYS